MGSIALFSVLSDNLIRQQVANEAGSARLTNPPGTEFIQLITEITSTLKGLCRGLTTAWIGRGRDQWAAPVAAQFGHSPVGADSDRDCIVGTTYPFWNKFPVRHQPGGWARPGQLEFGPLPGTQAVGKPGKLLRVRTDQNQALLDGSILELEQPVYCRFTPWVAAKPPHSLGGIAYDPVIQQLAYSPIIPKGQWVSSTLQGVLQGLVFCSNFQRV